MATRIRTDRWHNTGGNGPASATWCRQRGDLSVVIRVLRTHCVIECWQKNPADPFAPRAACIDTATLPLLVDAKVFGDKFLGVPARKSRARGKRFSVIGFYQGNNMPFVSWETTTTPKEAAQKAREDRANHRISIVEVVNGHVKGTLENMEVS